MGVAQTHQRRCLWTPQGFTTLDPYTIFTEYMVLYQQRISLKDEVAILLYHISQMLTIQGQARRAFDGAARAISLLKEDIRRVAEANLLKRIDGVGPVIEGIVKEISHTGTSSYYEQLLREWVE